MGDADRRVLTERGHTFTKDADGLWSCECSLPMETREEAEAACLRNADDDAQREAEEWAAETREAAGPWGAWL